MTQPQINVLPIIGKLTIENEVLKEQNHLLVNRIAELEKSMKENMESKKDGRQSD